MSDAQFFIVAIALFGMGFGVLWALRAGGRENGNGVADLTPPVPVGPSLTFWPTLGHCANGCGLIIEDGGYYCKRCREYYHLEESCR